MTGECPYKKSITSGWHDMCLICLGNIQRLASLNLNLFRVFVTRERRRAFLMCPAAGLPPRFVCHFVRPHKNATRSCVDEEGDGIGCLMDIPEAIILASWCFFYIFNVRLQFYRPRLLTLLSNSSDKIPGLSREGSPHSATSIKVSSSMSNNDQHHSITVQQKASFSVSFDHNKSFVPTTCCDACSVPHTNLSPHSRLHLELLKFYPSNKHQVPWKSLNGF